MEMITFFRQKRVDEAIRTGVDLGRETLFETFEDGPAGEFDNRLLWYVDLRFRGGSTPSAADEILPWLIDREAEIVEGLARCSEEFKVGFDPDFFGPMSEFNIPDATPTTVGVFFNTSSRIDAREVSRILTDVGDGWTHRLRALTRAHDLAS